jgi:hypothetical protein
MDKAPRPGAPGGTPAADAADPYGQAREHGRVPEDRAPQESTERAQVQEKTALDNVREGYDKPTPHPERDIESAPAPPGPGDPYRQGP